MEDIPYKLESHPPMTLRSPTIQVGMTAAGGRENEKWTIKNELRIESWKLKIEKPNLLKGHEQIVSWKVKN